MPDEKYCSQESKAGPYPLSIDSHGGDLSVIAREDKKFIEDYSQCQERKKYGNGGKAKERSLAKRMRESWLLEERGLAFQCREQ